MHALLTGWRAALQAPAGEPAGTPVGNRVLSRWPPRRARARRRCARRRAARGGRGRRGRRHPQAALVLVLLVVAAVVGLVVSFAAWGFLELVHQIQVGIFEKLPEQLGYDHGAPVWWPLPVLALAGLVTALAIVRLPGTAATSRRRG